MYFSRLLIGYATIDEYSVRSFIAVNVAKQWRCVFINMHIIGRYNNNSNTTVDRNILVCFA